MGFTAPIEYVYFIKAGEHVKIGRTTNGILGRLEAMQTANAHVLHCKLFIKIYARSHNSFIGESVERLVQSICAEHHVRGEWYKYHDAMRTVYENIGAIRGYMERRPSIRYFKIGFNGDAEVSRHYALWHKGEKEFVDGFEVIDKTSKDLCKAIQLNQGGTI